MTLQQQVNETISTLDNGQLEEVATYLSYLKFKSRRKNSLQNEDTKLAKLYAEFADDDQLLAEEGMAEYTSNLTTEDNK